MSVTGMLTTAACDQCCIKNRATLLISPFFTHAVQSLPICCHGDVRTCVKVSMCVYSFQLQFHVANTNSVVATHMWLTSVNVCTNWITIFSANTILYIHTYHAKEFCTSVYILILFVLNYL